MSNVNDPGLWSSDEEDAPRDARIEEAFDKDKDIGLYNEYGIATIPGSPSDVESDTQMEADESMSSFYSDLRTAVGFKRKMLPHKKKRGRRSIADLDPSGEVRALLGEANQYFANGQLEKSQKLLEEVIRIDFNIYAAWKTLGEVHCDRGDEEKCLLAWITAAHLKPRDASLWIQCAKLSEAHNRRQQTIYCYSRAITAKPRNVALIFERARLYKENGNFAKALEQYKHLQKWSPFQMNVIRELARIYHYMKNPTEGIKLYEAALAHYRAKVKSPSTSCPFSLSEVNIMAELYIEAGRYMDSIHAIRSTCRWLIGRGEESYWDKIVADDREWDADDKRRQEIRDYVPRQNAQYRLPIEIRVKLGICRLEIGNVEEAEEHFFYLKDQQPEIMGDLYFDVGIALMKHEFWDPAMNLFERLVDTKQSQSSELWFAMAACYQGTDDVSSAIRCLERIAANDRSNEDARLQLADLLQKLDRREEALALLTDVVKIRREPGILPERSRPEELMSVVAVRKRRSRKTKPPKSEVPSMPPKSVVVSKEADEEKIAATFRQLDVLRPGVERGVANDIRDWLQNAEQLVKLFRGTKALYPADKSTVFKGFSTRIKRSTTPDRTADGTASVREKDGRGKSTSLDVSTSEFLGLQFGDWFAVFMQYALFLTVHRSLYLGIEIIQAARDSSIFYQDRAKMHTTYSVQLACALYASDLATVSDCVRFFMNKYQCRPETYRLYAAAFSSGTLPAIDFFSSSANQKYILRLIKAIDASVNEENIPGMASLHAETHPDNSTSLKPKTYDAHVLLLYGQILNCCRSHYSALSMYSEIKRLIQRLFHEVVCSG